MKRLAFNHIKYDTFDYSPGIIEIEGNMVMRIYPLIEEIEKTEWIGGTAYLKKQNNRFQAFKQAILIKE